MGVGRARLRVVVHGVRVGEDALAGDDEAAAGAADTAACAARAARSWAPSARRTPARTRTCSCGYKVLPP